MRTEDNTRGHVLVVMLAYLIVRELERARGEFDLTMEEGIEELNRLCVMEFSIEGGGSGPRLPDPAAQTKKLFDVLKMKIPDYLPQSKITTDTKKKLSTCRKKFLIPSCYATFGKIALRGTSVLEHLPHLSRFRIQST